MPRLITCLTAMLVVSAGAALAQTPMQPTAREKMPSPEQALKMQACEKQAAQQNIKMNERSKFVMDCMTAKAK